MKSVLIILVVVMQATAFAANNLVYFESEYTAVNTLDQNNQMVPASQEIIGELNKAANDVIGDLADKCFEDKGHFFNNQNNIYISNGIVVLEPNKKYERSVGGDNFEIGAKNLFLFVPRLLKKGYAEAIYQADRAVTGSDMLEGASEKMFNPDSFKNSYEVDLSTSLKGWMHLYTVENEYIAKAYVLRTAEAMRNFMRDFFKKGSGCYDYPRIGE